MARIRIGTSGYRYPHWRGVLYPEGLARRLWLPRYAAYFDTVELNATFHRLPSPETVDRWRALAPPGFTFAVTGSRYLTHLRVLLDSRAGVRQFFDPVSRLGGKLGPVLWQLPPHLAPDLPRLDRFLAALPPGLHAVEFRDPAWYSDETCAVLDRHGAAFCEHDRASRPPRLTGAFRYVRFHGSTADAAGRYGPRVLRGHAESFLDSAARGVPVFVYFGDDVGGRSVRDALDLLALVGEERPGRAAP